MQPIARNCTKLVSIIISLTAAHAATGQGREPAREYWGAETNGVKAGLFFDLAPGSTNQVEVSFVPVLNNCLTTNGNFIKADHLRLWLPPFDSRYKMELTDEVGNPVKKTKKGEALGRSYAYSAPRTVTTGSPTDRAVMLTPNKPEILPERVSNKIPFGFRSLSLQDYFRLRNPGRYHFTFQMTVLVCGMKTPWDLHLVSLPPVDVHLDLQLPQNTFSSQLRTYVTTYGVDILGLALCIVGVVWLVAHRQRRSMAGSAFPTAIGKGKGVKP